MGDSIPLLGAGGAAGGEPKGSATFKRQGKYWLLAFGGRTVLLRDSKGLHYLVHLLQRAGQRVSVIDLAPATSSGAGSTDQAVVERARSAVTKRIHDSLQKIEKNHPQLGRHLSARVKTGYECIYSPDPDQPIDWQL